MSDATVEFRVLVAMFEAMQRSKSSVEKRKKFRKFIDHCYHSREYFSAIRLILPSLDRERSSYGLKESVLAICLIDALVMSRESEDALRLINWRKGGAKTGANVGNFALVAAEVLQRRQGTASGGLKIKELNHILDRLASSENRGEKTSILSDLIKKTNAKEMKWILMIILKDLKLGVSEKTLFHEFHPDAEDLFNVTCDLKLVCEKLKDRTQRHKRQDIEVGKAVRPQLATRVSDAANAWKKLHGKQVVVECKFDGDRIQIHKNGTEIQFFSRNFINHPEYGPGLSNIIFQNILVDRCILDGEMLVWDASANRFSEFGSNQEIAKAAKEGLQTDRQLCYVAFDILYVGDTSVIHRTLKERHGLLRKIIKPCKGRLEILVPDGGLNTTCAVGEPCWSLIAHSVEDVEIFFKETIENRDEGVVLKDLDSKWEPGDRSGKWLKLKPDYMHASSDLDVLIIGGYFGSGRRGGEVAQFLVGLAERSAPNSYPKRFISFCRVGTGLSDDELDTLVFKLKPYFRKNENPKRAPIFYEVTYNSKERPDVWVDSPEKSVILSITSDIRTIKSTVFAAPYSLRFPRIDRVRYDKPWYECLDVQSFVDLVHSNNGNAQRPTDDGRLQDKKAKHVKASNRRGKQGVSVVPCHLTQTDVSSVKGATNIFSNMIFYFVNVPHSHSVESFHKLVTENGGAFSMNLNATVTHCIASERKGIKYEAAILRGDVIHYSWVLDCASQKRLLHLQPKYFLFLAESSKWKFQDLDTVDIKQRKYCPSGKWGLFEDCHFYFHYSLDSVDKDCQIVMQFAMRRMEVEVFMHGGEVIKDLSHATHVVVFSVSGTDLDFGDILQSFPAAKRNLLYNKTLHIVRHQWLENSLEHRAQLPLHPYSLKPEGLEELTIEHSQPGVDGGPVLESREKRRPRISPNAGEKRKGRSVRHNPKRAKTIQQTRARHGNEPAKIDPGDSENGGSSDEASEKSESGLREKARVDVGNVAEGDTDIGGSEKGKHQQGFGDGKREEGPCNKNKGESEVDGAPANRKPEETYNVLMSKEHEKSSSEEKVDSRERMDSREKLYSREIMDLREKVDSKIDPVQALLFEMVPSLAQTRPEREETRQDTEKIVNTDVKPPLDHNGNPVKKKVSYKDVASHWLKDW
ncbi:hypothetical protein H6P81_009182 [Aristolochia fimbriata]|uniref:DNA ligase n=1 Tax=Aristolochia fimbriata TaxID=158543 RepID=A0AAV7ENL7_ARIFI|nr:hypothetical protein H6P81_009182 [Aristolochia fimbriata]